MVHRSETARVVIGQLFVEQLASIFRLLFRRSLRATTPAHQSAEVRSPIRTFSDRDTPSCRS